MASQESFTKLKRKFDALSDQQSYTKNGYYKVVRIVSGRRLVYTVPLVNGRYVKEYAVKMFCERLRIAPDEWDAA